MKKTNHNWCEYYGYEPNENLETYFELNFQEYYKKCVKENKRRYGKNYNQEVLVINEELQKLKKEIFG